MRHIELYIVILCSLLLITFSFDKNAFVKIKNQKGDAFEVLIWLIILLKSVLLNDELYLPLFYIVLDFRTLPQYYSQYFDHQRYVQALYVKDTFMLKS